MVACSRMIPLTTKSIDTLVDDIYALVKGGTEIPDELCTSFGEQMAELLKSRLKPRTPSKGRLRLSSMGKPDRQIWYEYHGFKGEEMQGHTYLKFLIGDVWETVVLTLAKASGHEVTDEQATVQLGGVTGHIDARIDGVLTDVKSASTYSFKKFKEGTLKQDDPFGYVQQISSYWEATKKSEADDTVAFLAGDKQNGHLTLMKLIDIEMPDAEARVEHVKVMVEGELPAKCYDVKPMGTSGNMQLDIGCSYCAYKHECWKDANDGKGLRTFLYSNGVVHLTEVKNEPKVTEIT